MDRLESHVVGGAAAPPAGATPRTTPKTTPGPAAGGAFARVLSEETKPTRPKTAAAPKAPAAEATEPVAGHAYAEIVAGPRNGMFLNTSGNKRDGQAFERVERGDFYYHIYGNGKDRTIIRLDRD